MLVRAKYFSTGAPSVPLTSGWMNGAYPMLAPPIGRGTFSRAMSTPLGGTVTPVEQIAYNEIDCWLWLEWVMEEYDFTHHTDNKLHGHWRPVPVPKQWNLWNEYDL